MNNALADVAKPDHVELCAHLEAPLRSIARRAVRVWFNRQRLDQLLSDAIGRRIPADLIYAIDISGRQLSSNIYADRRDETAYGQDLSRRPYAVTPSLLNNAAFGGAFQCDSYISKTTQRACVTLMYGATSGPDVLGFIAADIDLDNLP